MPVRYDCHSGWLGADTSWQEGIPWWRPGSVQFVQDFFPEPIDVLEWGSGGSTVWLARQGFNVTSIENNHDWAAQVRERLANEGLLSRVNLLDFSPPDSQRMQEYADYPLGLPDDSFHLVCVDGRNRQRCVGNALGKVKVGGVMLLDNSERVEYADAVALMDTWDGIAWGDEGWMTTAWIRLLESVAARVELPNADA